MGRVEGKVAFITGAARGQGRAHAVRLAEEGADIIALDALAPIPNANYAGATEEDLAETVRQVEALDRRIVAEKADVRSLAEVQAVVDKGVAELGRLDIVVANAGILTQTALVEDLTEELWDDMVNVNLSGVWRTCKASIPHIKAGGRGGSIILTSSAAGLKGSRNVGHYVAAKTGVVGLMKTMAQELGQYDIRVNTVNPTQVNTDMIMNEAMYRLFAPHLEVPDPAVFAEVSQGLNLLPVPWIEARDVANTVLFLASDEGRYYTGATLTVDAGMLNQAGRG
jgi:(+)-trans-carveol dehydrogenase